MQEVRQRGAVGIRKILELPGAMEVQSFFRMLRIGENVAARCPCCDGFEVKTRHARICPTLKRLGTPHQVESGASLTADRNLGMDIFNTRGCLREAPNSEYGDKTTLLLSLIHI